jgi:hypothetical protein
MMEPQSILFSIELSGIGGDFKIRESVFIMGEV